MSNLNKTSDNLIHNIMLMENSIDRILAVNHSKNKHQSVKQKRRFVRLKDSLLNDLKNIYQD